MKTFILLSCLCLGACGSAANDAAKGNQASSTSVDAVTAEAVADTQAAKNDATAAADAALDQLSNSIDDPAPTKAAAGSGRAKVVTY